MARMIVKDGFHQRVIENLSDTVLLTDDDGNIRYACPNVSIIFKYSQDEVMALGKLEALVGEQALEIEERSLSGELTNLEWTISDREGGRHDLLVNVKSVDIDGSTRLYSCRDVTDRQWKEAEFVDRLNLMQSTFEGMGEAVLVVEPGGRTIRFSNPAVREIFGYSPEELQGRSLELLFPNHQAFENFLEHSDVELRETGACRGEFQLVRKDGSVIEAEGTLTARRENVGWRGGGIGLVRDLTERKRTELAILESRERLRNLSQRLQSVREEERAMLAREIHDDLGQTLTALRIEVKRLEKRLGERGGREKDDIARLVKIIEFAIDTVRDIAGRLRPPLLDDVGLEAALEWQVKEFRDYSGCRCTIEIVTEQSSLPREAQLAVFRILQESLTNVARHARAQQVEVIWRQVDDGFELTVSDDGCGFPDGRLEHAGSLGIVGMRERAGALGGRLIIEPRNGGGTVVTLRLPSAIAGGR